MFVRPIVMDCLADPSGGCDLRGSFADDLYVLIGLSGGSFLWVPSRSLSDVVHLIHRPTLTLDCLLLRNTIAWCSNITVYVAAWLIDIIVVSSTGTRPSVTGLSDIT